MALDPWALCIFYSLWAWRLRITSQWRTDVTVSWHGCLKSSLNRSMALLQQLCLWNYFPPWCSIMGIIAKWRRLTPRQFRYWQIVRPCNVIELGSRVLRLILRKSRQSSADSITAKFQTSSSLCPQLHGIGFHGQSAPIGVMCRWPITFANIVDVLMK